MAKLQGMLRMKHRCWTCPHMHYDRSLEYMPEYQCKAHGNARIYIGVPGEMERMKWCPLWGSETENEEMEMT